MNVENAETSAVVEENLTEQQTTETSEQQVQENKFDQYRELLEGKSEEQLVAAIDRGELPIELAAEYQTLASAGENVFTEPSTEEVSSDSQGEVSETQTEQETQQETSETQESVDPVEERLSKLERQVQEKQSLIDKLRTDLSNAKGPQQQEQLPEMSDEERIRYEQNPVAYLNAYQRQQMQLKSKHEQAVRTAEPELDNLLPTIKDLAKKDSAIWAPGAVDVFIADPLDPRLSNELQLYIQKAKNVQLTQRLADLEKKGQEKKLQQENVARQRAKTVSGQKKTVTANASNTTDTEGGIDLDSIHKAGGDAALIELIDKGQITWSDVDAWEAKKG